MITGLSEVPDRGGFEVIASADSKPTPNRLEWSPCLIAFSTSGWNEKGGIKTTNAVPEITQIPKRHGRAGVPMYLVYSVGCTDQQPVVMPGLIASQTIIQALNRM
jgi:hypothetical protein